MCQARCKGNFACLGRPFGTLCNMKTGRRFFSLLLGIAVTVALEAWLILPPALAVDIPIEGYVEGGLTISLFGDWNTGIDFGSLPSLSYDVVRYWDGVDSSDYIELVDDTGTTTPGFHLAMSMTNFIYVGSSTEQGPIDSTNFKMFGEYANGTSSAAGKGYNDQTKTLSILLDSCAGATVDTYTLNSDLTDSAKQYAITGTTTSQVVLQSNADCLNISHLRFDRLLLKIPANSAIGTYTSTVTLTIIDGLP